ncbi:MAG: hydroxymyristoyl-ACP dehydratase [Cyclobacteriaceae bacterium]
MITKEEIIKLLPYQPPFRFVDELTYVSDERIEGKYTYKKEEYFYQGHFPNNPITPGVILVETMAQIGLVSLGIYLSSSEFENKVDVIPVFTSSNVDYLSPVLPEETVIVKSSKVYFRFGKLKCKVECWNESTGKVACKGEFSGMIINKQKIE